MKKFIFSVFLLLSAKSYAIAHEIPPLVNFPVACPPELGLIDEFYLGVGFGYDAQKVGQSYSILDSSFIRQIGHLNLSSNGLVTKAYGGFGRYLEWSYYGGEIFIDYSIANGSFNLNPYHFKIITRESYGLGLQPGIRVNNTTLVYTRFDFVRTYFKTKETHLLGDDIVQTAWGNGLKFSLGIETAITDRLSLRTEGSYVFYGSFSSDIVRSKSEVSNIQFYIGINYHFFANDSCT